MSQRGSSAGLAPLAPNPESAEHAYAIPAPVSSCTLLRGNSCIEIDHLGTRYVLRATRTGKLILTK